MLDVETKNRINTARDILVGKVPDPKSQVEQITIALIYKFMDDMDVEAEELGGKRTFFVGEYAKYAWRKIFDPRQSGYELLNLYSEAITKMDTNPGVPKLFRDIFKNAYLPYRDPETLKSFLKIINDFEYSHSEKLGDAFEFLLSILGSQGDAGQFRTPRHIIDFMVATIDPKKHEVILDPACGTAGFLISSYKHIVKQNSSNYLPEQNTGVTVNGTQSVNEVIITTNGYSGDKLTSDERRILADNIHGYDISPDMVRLSLVNMYLHGIKEPHISEYDTLTSEDHWNQFCDVILANPPFMSPKGGIRPHKRFSVQSNRSEVLFVNYIAEHLTPDGRAAVIVPEGIIFQSGTAYKQLRKMLVEKYLVGVISLPAGVFQPYSGVKTSILWLDKVLAKKTDKILFVKIENDGFDLGAQRRAIKENDIPKAIQKIILFKQQIYADVNKTNDNHVINRNQILTESHYSLSGERYNSKKIGSGEYPYITIRKVCKLVGGGTPSKQEPKYWTNGTLKWISSKHIDSLGKVQDYELITEAGLKESSTNIAPKGSTIIITRVSVGKSAYALEDFAINQDLTALISLDKSVLNEKYLFLCSSIISQMVAQNAQGIGVRGVTRDFLSDIKIPLPPLHIQDEIVSEIESYQKIIDGARMVVVNYKPRIEIDPEWEMVELGTVCIVNPKKNEVKGLSPNLEVSFVPMADLNENMMDFDPKQVRHLNEVQQSYTYFKDKDVLIARVTPCFENGKAGVASNLCNGIGFGSSEYTVIRCTEKVLPEWVYIWITTDTFRKEGKLRMTGTGGLQRVPNDFVSSHLIPLPDIVTQKNHISEVNLQLQYVNTNKKLIEIYNRKIKDRIAKVWGGVSYGK